MVQVEPTSEMLSASATGSVIPIRASTGGFTISGLLKTGGKVQQELEEESSAVGGGEGSGEGSSSSVSGTVTGTIDTEPGSDASIEESAEAAADAAVAAEGSGEETSSVVTSKGEGTGTAPSSPEPAAEEPAAEEGGNPPEQAGGGSGSGEQGETQGGEEEAGDEEAPPPPCGKGPCVTIANSLGNYVISGTLHETLSPQDAERIEMYEEQTGRDIADMFKILPNITAASERLAESRDRLSSEKDALSDQVCNFRPHGCANDARVGDMHCRIMDASMTWRAVGALLRLIRTIRPLNHFSASPLVLHPATPRR